MNYNIFSKRLTLVSTVGAVLIGVSSAISLNAQNFGVHFLGNLTDTVTGTAGVVPIANWNNIANTTYTLGSVTTITADDGSTTATLILSGLGAQNGWNSGITGDGANLSLMHGYIDSGANQSANVVISNLPGAHYNVYVYGFPDQTRPSNGGDLLPNYSINGVTYYAPLDGGTGATTYDTTSASVGGTNFDGFIQASAALANSSSKPVATSFGNYIEFVNVATVNGAITIKSEADATSFRSPLNGVEIVPATASAPVPNSPLESPAAAATGILAGTNVTLTASAGGTAPISFQWQTDGGSGGALTNIPGATGTVLQVNTAGWASGMYYYNFVASNSLGAVPSPQATIAIVSQLMLDLGPNAPTPGPNDVSQLLNTSQSDDGFNYYTDNGANHNEWNGQTFTTGGALTGYVLTSLAWKSAGNGNSFGTIQLYDLYIYAIAPGGATATQIGSYQMPGGGTELDWFQFTGLNTPLAPNTQYAYALGRDHTAGGWEHIANQGGNVYAGGKTCEIPSAGGAITYGSAGASDATFDIGLAISQSPFASLPTYSPALNPLYAGTPMTLSEAAVGAAPLSYQWLADNGSGTLSAVGGATNSTLAVDTTGFAAGNYEYAVTVTNSHGSSTSATLTITVAAASAPMIVNDITPAPVNEGYVGQTLQFSATFTGTLPITYQWLVDTGSGPTAISGSSNPTALSNTLTLTNIQLSSAGTYTLTALNAVGGPVSSSSSALTVLPIPAGPASNTYEALVLSNGPVAFWQFDETNDPSLGVLPAYDATGHGFIGVYGQYAQNGYDGIFGPESPLLPGFPSTNYAVGAQNGVTNSWVTVPALNLNTNTVTITMWIYPTANEPTFSGLLNNRPYGAGFGFGGTLNGSGMAELGYTWNNNEQSTWSFNSGLYPLLYQWSFVALTIQPAQATISLYYTDPNTGQPDLYSSVSTVTNIAAPFTSGITDIGTDPNSGATAVTRAFSGYMDDVAVFNKALTGDQLLTMFGFASGFTEIAPSPQAPIEAPSTASTSLLAGSNVTLTASAGGTAPITYQWQTDGGSGGTLTNIPGATATTLSIDTTGWALGAYNYDYVASNSLGAVTSPEAAITIVPVIMADIGPNAPAPGPNDISQLLNTSQNDDGFNYYTDNGANHNGWNGQTFTTGNSPSGYVLKSLAWKSAGNGNSFGVFQLYHLYIYSLSNGGASATLVTNYQAFGGGVEDDWFQWLGLNTALAGNTQYAYALGRDATAAGWEHIADQGGNPYSGGQICQVPAAGGTVAYANSGNSDATFDIGLLGPPSVTVNIAAGAGGILSLTWSQGTLVQATNLLGPWVTNNTASPYTVSPTNAQMFFKVLVQ